MLELELRLGFQGQAKKKNKGYLSEVLITGMLIASPNGIKKNKRTYKEGPVEVTKAMPILEAAWTVTPIIRAHLTPMLSTTKPTMKP